MYTLLKKFPTGEQAHNYNFQNPKKKVVLLGMTPPSAPKVDKFYEKGHFITWLDPKMYKNRKNTTLWFAPPILKKFQNVKIDKSISAL